MYLSVYRILTQSCKFKGEDSGIMKKEKSVSEIIAVILLISVVVGTLSITGVYLTREIVPSKIPILNFDACVEGGTVWLYHTGGDSLNPRENNADFYLKLLDKDKNIIKTTLLMPWSDEPWSSGQVLKVATTLHPTLDPSIKYVQIIAKSSGSGENLIDYAQTGSCSLTPESGPGCLARPTAVFLANPQSGYPPLTVNFIDESQTDDPAYPVTSWEWNFDDGNTSTLKNSTHTFTTAGTYLVKLRVHNACGSDEISHPVLVGTTCPSTVTADFTTDPSPPITNTNPTLKVNFTSTSVSSGSTIETLLWDFGDGSPIESGPFVSHTFSNISWVRLTAIDACGHWDDELRRVTVTSLQDCYITPNIRAVPSSGPTPLTVNLTDISESSRGIINSWYWEFGDGTTSTGQGPHTKIYTNPGPTNKMYQVNLTVKNDCGANGTTFKNIIVYPPGHLILATADPGGKISPGGILFPNGTITPEAYVNVLDGKDQSFTMTPDSDCYKNVDVKVDGVSKGPLSSYTFSNVVEDHTIHVNFTRLSYTITPIANPHGNINISTVQSVWCGEDRAFRITADPCYTIANIRIQPEGQTGFYLYPQMSQYDAVLTNIHANTTITATFAQLIPIITASTGTGGTISPNGNVQVNCSNNQSFVITANPCYSILNIIIDGLSSGPQSTPNTTWFRNVTTNHTIRAEFQYLSYPITATAGTGGSISPVGNVTVPCGANQTFTVTANYCYQINNLTVDGNTVTFAPFISQSTYAFTNVTAPHAISATFAPRQPYINSSAIYFMPGSYTPYPVNGMISPQGLLPITCGNTPTYTITQTSFTPSGSGITYDFADMLVDGVSVGAVTSYTFPPVLYNRTIVAVYGPRCYFLKGNVFNQTTKLPVANARIEFYKNATPDVLLWTTITTANGTYSVPNVVANAKDRYDAYIGNTSPYYTSWKTVNSYLYEDPKPIMTGPWRYEILFNPGSKCDRYLDWNVTY